MYILIFEDNQIRKADKLDEQMLDDCDAGLLDIISVGDDLIPLLYVDGEWERIPGAL